MSSWKYSGQSVWERISDADFTGEVGDASLSGEGELKTLNMGFFFIQKIGADLYIFYHRCLLNALSDIPFR